MALYVFAECHYPESHGTIGVECPFNGVIPSVSIKSVMLSVVYARCSSATQIHSQKRLWTVFTTLNFLCNFRMGLIR
jgi:hypothetical protein